MIQTQETCRLLKIGAPFRDLWLKDDREVLMEGPRGTGKTVAALYYIHDYCETNPGTRALMGRKTRASMTNSTLTTFEDVVLGRGHLLLGDTGLTRARRENYVYPNGSQIVVAGTDDEYKFFSSEYAVIYVNEAIQLTLDQWESLWGSLRWPIGTRRRLIGDCNPSYPSHWLNERCTRGLTVRMRTTHKDNPAYYDRATESYSKRGLEYLEGLFRTSGFRRKRWVEGLWCAAEGAIFPDWLGEKRTVTPQDVPANCWYLAACDFGYRAPGVLQVWAIDGKQNYFLVREVYRREMRLDWWAARIEEARRAFPFELVVADSAEPRTIIELNYRLRDGSGCIVRAADKSKRGTTRYTLYGLNALQEKVERSELFIVEDSLHMSDEDLLERGQPVGLSREMEGAIWKETDAARGTNKYEEISPSCPDHSLDTAIFALLYGEGKDMRRTVDRPRYAPGTLGHRYGHNEIEEEESWPKRQEPGHEDREDAA